MEDLPGHTELAPVAGPFVLPSPEPAPIAGTPALQAPPLATPTSSQSLPGSVGTIGNQVAALQAILAK
eukprot:10008514-Lingulodinium_polyedra.AAC.1